MLSIAIAIYPLYGPRFFLSDAADSTDIPQLQAPGYPWLAGQCCHPRVQMLTKDHLGQKDYLLLSSRNI